MLKPLPERYVINQKVKQRYYFGANHLGTYMSHNLLLFSVTRFHYIPITFVRNAKYTQNEFFSPVHKLQYNSDPTA